MVGALALTGALKDLEAKSREVARTEAERGRFADVELLLILHLLSTCGADLTNLVADPARWRDKDAKSAVAAAAVAVGVKRKDIQPRIVELTALLAPVGLVGSGEMIQADWCRVLRGHRGRGVQPKRGFVIAGGTAGRLASAGDC